MYSRDWNKSKNQPYFKKKKYPTRHLVWAKTNSSVMNGEKEYLVPVVDSIVTEKNTDDGYVKVRPIKGLFGDED